MRRGSKVIGFEENEAKTSPLSVLVEHEPLTSSAPLLLDTALMRTRSRHPTMSPIPTRSNLMDGMFPTHLSILRSLTIRSANSIMVGAAPGIDPSRPEEFHSAIANLKNNIYSGFLVDFSKSELFIEEQVDNIDVEKLLQTPRPPGCKVRWLCVEGLSRAAIAALAKGCKLHPLAVEDMVRPPAQTKVDFYDDHIHMSLVMLSQMGASHAELGSEASKNDQQRHHNSRPPCPVVVAMSKASMCLLRNNMLVTVFPSGDNGIAEATLMYLHNHDTLLREREDASMLLHALLDRAADMCIPVVDGFADKINDLESIVCSRNARAHVSVSTDLHWLASELFGLKRTIAPLQRLIDKLMTHGVTTNPEEKPWLSRGTLFYLSNVKDNLNCCLEEIDALSAQSKDLISLVFNMTSHETNIAMKTLTMASIIFLPMTFFAGIWGMNYEHMPELKWEYGYLFAWSIMVASATAFLLFAKISVSRSLSRAK